MTQPAAPRRSAHGAVALVLGVLGVPGALFGLPGLVLGIPAVIVGIRGRRRARGEPGGDRLATIGAILGACDVVIAILQIVLIVTQRNSVAG